MHCRASPSRPRTRRRTVSAPPSPARRAVTCSPALPPGEYELRAEIAGFQPHVQRGLALTVAETVVVNLTLQLGALEEVNDVDGRLPLVNTSSSELSYLVGADTIETLPLNGRNYTDLALLQPGVLAYPHRDGGSVVAHGLGMSVNGQDPRANVYLLDGTLQNDFTNGPAGSAAGTALGMETVREFRVETNAYGAEFGRSCRRPDQRPDQVGHQPSERERLRVPPQRRARRAQLSSTRSASPTSRATSSAAPSAARSSQNRLFFFGGYEALHRAAGQDDLDDRARRQRAARHPPDRRGRRQPRGRALSRRVPARQRAGARSGARGLQVPLRPAPRRALRPGASRLQRRRATSSSAATPSTTPSSSCPPTIRSFRGPSSRATSSSPASTGEVLSDSTLNTARLSFSRTRIGQDVEANTSQPLCALRARPVDHGRHRHRRAPALRAAELGRTCAWCRTCSASRTTSCTSRGRHLIKAGAPRRALPGQHGQPDLQPGHLRLPEPERVPAQSCRTTSSASRRKRSSTATGASRCSGSTLQDESAVTPTLSVNAGLRYEFTTMPEDIYGRDSSLPDLTASQPTIGPLYQNPTYTNLSPRVGLRVGRLRRRHDLRARRLRALLQHHQPAEPHRHRHQPAGHAAAGHRQPDVSRRRTSTAREPSRCGRCSSISTTRAFMSSTPTSSASSGGARR